jgi:pilus assembly protein CpaE
MPSENFIVAIISRDRRIHEEIATALSGRISVESVWTLAEYPDPASLAEIRQAAEGCVVFLDFSDPVRAEAVAGELDRTFPRAATVALCPSAQPKNLLQLMQLGVREVLALPCTGAEVVRAFHRVMNKLAAPAGAEQGGRLYAFLPAKPGVGATTLASHSAAAAARLTQARTLLLDFDFRLGITSFLFKLSGQHSVVDAINTRASLGGDVWDRMVSRRGTLDILGSAPTEFGNTDPEAGAVELVDLARRAYGCVCVDLPGEMRDYELETMNRASECFLVTTADITALHMAKRKAATLHSLGLQTKVSVILNRVQGRGGMSIKEVESILQLPVVISAPAAEREITLAVQAGKALEGRTPLVAQIENIARRMSPGVPVQAESKTRKFIDMFSVSRVRDGGAWGWQSDGS